ncbi:hypothetical protein Y032_0901g2954 [Ancylostoma ceylanicum]|uniref:Uncharacterized protein n=1 Tax=Ancylostoma ceylanicum TaxID=53326 RepID=A0A016WAS5_9BILA|nr:hypothetical protein Y032_0901g2954 [Ancylostoma ceylanicum]
MLVGIIKSHVWDALRLHLSIVEELNTYVPLQSPAGASDEPSRCFIISDPRKDGWLSCLAYVHYVDGSQFAGDAEIHDKGQTKKSLAAFQVPRVLQDFIATKVGA